jgi:ribonuclease BN (tRNA processing enzyme)
VRVTLVPSAVGSGSTTLQYLTSVVINDAVAIDAGCLGLWGTPQEQARVKHLFLSHSHADHLASLPVLLLNAYKGDGDCPTVYGSAWVLDCLARDLFNDRLWPDFLRISRERPPYLRLEQLEPGVAVECAGLRVTPVEVNHAVPTLGFLVQEPGCAVAFSSDTGPTQALWDLANATPDLGAVFLEVTFPDRLAWLADLSRHLTPSLFAAEARKVKRPVPFVAVHLQPTTRDEVVRELHALGLPDVRVGEFGVPYEF